MTKPKPKRIRKPKPRAWVRSLRAVLVAAMDDLRRRMAGADLVNGDHELAGELDALVETLSVVRCYKCGCSDAEACPDGCEWVQDNPPLCSACKNSGRK